MAINPVLKSNLVIQTAFLGDLILSVPTLRRLKQIYPEDKLIVLCKKGLGEFLIKEHIADEVIEVEKSDSRSYRNAAGEISQFQIRNIYCLHRSLRSQLFAAGIKAEKKIGFASFAGFWIFDDLIDYRAGNPEVIRQFAILETSDADTFEKLHSADFVGLNSVGSEKVPAFFAFKPPSATKKLSQRVAIFPGSVWATKKWTASGFTELASLLTGAGYKVDILGGAGETALCEGIAAQVPGTSVQTGHSIAETIRAISNYDLVISNDSAPTHMAAYNNTPVITIFGPTTLKQGFRPWSDNSAVIENFQLTCRPCGKHGHNECPLTHHNCMKSITAAEVFAKAVKILS